MPKEKQYMGTLAPAYDFSVVRSIRKREGMTLQQVCAKSTVSAAVLSRIERNRTVPELETLYRLARVFGLTATDLMSLAERRSAQSTQESRYRSDRFSFRRVSYGNMQAFYGTAPEGAHIRKPEIHHDEYELCWVLKGAVRIFLPDEIHELKAGQAVQFDAILEHTYEALHACEIVIVHVTKGKRF